MYLRTDNSFTARGRLVSAPNYNISKSGNVVTSIRLAQETPFKDKEGNFKVAYIDYVATDTKHNNIATRLAEYTTKGSLVSLVGYHDSYSKEIDGKTMYYQVNRIESFRNEEGKEVTEKRLNENRK